MTRKAFDIKALRVFISIRKLIVYRINDCKRENFLPPFGLVFQPTPKYDKMGSKESLKESAYIAEEPYKISCWGMGYPSAPVQKEKHQRPNNPLCGDFFWKPQPGMPEKIGGSFCRRVSPDPMRIPRKLRKTVLGGQRLYGGKYGWTRGDRRCWCGRMGNPAEGSRRSERAASENHPHPQRRNRYPLRNDQPHALRRRRLQGISLLIEFNLHRGGKRPRLSPGSFIGPAGSRSGHEDLLPSRSDQNLRRKQWHDKTG